MMMKVIIMVLVLSSYTVAGQVKITGKITDKISGEELIGANIWLKSDLQKGVTTDINAKYSLPVSAISRQSGDSLFASYIGYQTYSTYIKANAPAQTLDIELIPTKITLNAVTVSENGPIAEEFNVRQIEQLEIYLVPTAQADPLLAVNILPSSTNTDESAALNFRGTNTNQNGLFINEVPLYDYLKFSSINSVGSRGILDNTFTKEELIYPSNPPMEYGNVSAGLVAYTTEEKVKEKLTASASLASLSLQGGITVKEKSTIKFFSNLQTYPVWQFFNKQAFRDIKKFNVEDIGLQFFTRPFKNSIFKFYTYGIREAYNYYLRRPSHNETSLYQNKRMFNILNYKQSFGKFVSSLNGGYSIGNSEYFFGNTDVSESRKYLYLAGDVLYLANKWSNRTGVTYENRSFGAIGIVPELFYALSETSPTVQIDSLIKKEIPEIFSYSKLEFIDKTTIGFGIRKNLLNKGIDNYTSSQVNLRYDLTSKQNIKFSYGTYHRFTQPQSESYAGNLYRSNQMAIDYGYTTDKTSFSASLYMNKFENLDSEIRNKIYGAELFTRTRIHKKIISSIGYTYIRNVGHAKNGTSYKDNPNLNFFLKSNTDIRLRSSYSIGISVLYRNGNFYTPIEGNIIDQYGLYQPVFLDKNSKQLPAYFRTDFAFTKIVGIKDNKRIVIFFQIQNVFNNNNVSYINYNSDYSAQFNEVYQKRNYYFGVQFSII